MKIDSSIIFMDSAHYEEQTDSVQSMTSWSAKEAENPRTAAKLSLSERAKEMFEEQKRANEKRMAEEAAGREPFMDKLDIQNELLRKMMEVLRKLRRGQGSNGDIGRIAGLLNDVFQSSSPARSPITHMGTSSSRPAGIRNGEWEVTTKFSSFHSEQEVTAFRSAGSVKTVDGREISFNLEFEMSRSFTQYLEFEQTETVKIMTDPLVINMGSNVAGVSDQKFLFDLDADGDLDEVSQLQKESGFLALDKNGDGIINDGNELFGTKSGDGFADLSEYDKDGNHWIDENDEIYDKLKVWVKDENGNDKLLSLKEADIGAIFLGNVSTQHSLNDLTTNETNAMIRKTGVYLRESTGEAGTVQHVDFAI